MRFAKLNGSHKFNVLELRTDLCLNRCNQSINSELRKCRSAQKIEEASIEDKILEDKFK